MYYPILKGKQYELAALKELIGHIPPNNVCPILEPVKVNLSAIATSIFSLSRYGITPWVIINPSQGDFSGAASTITTPLLSQLTILGGGTGQFIPCIKVCGATDVSGINLLRTLQTPFVAYVEGEITPILASYLMRASIIALDPNQIDHSILRNFSSIVLFRDSFDKKTRNLDYGTESYYSELHTNYRLTPNAIGFGDYTILGQRFSKGGGPAYVVTLHLSYLDQTRLSHMYVRHFSSHSDSTSQSDPGGKFREALSLLVLHVNSNSMNFINTEGLQEFYKYHNSRHYPGLGIAKKCSIKHHIQTLSTW